MRTINATVGSIPNLLIQLGTQGEHNSTRIVIDYTEWIDDDFAGYPTIECVSPAGYLYNVAVSVETIGDKSRIIWLISEDDTAECGKGTMRVVMHRSDGSIIRSATCRTVVLEGLSAVERPDRYDDWIAELSRLSSGITSASADAINAAAAAKVFAESAASINEHASYIDTAMNIFVPVSGWKLNSAGKWQYVISNVLITSNVFADINLDDSAELLNSMIEAETGNGTLTLTTAVKPDGDLNGTAQLCGRIRAYFDQDFKTYMDSKLQAKQDVISDLSIIRARANQGMIAYTNLTTSPAYSIETDDINAWNDKQNKLTAGENIVIDGDTISATVESVTSSTIVSALGYTPADDSDITGVTNSEHTATAGQVWTASEDGAGWEDVPVKGVQVAGTDLVPDADGKVNVPIASDSSKGVVRINPNTGVRILSDGSLALQGVNETGYTNRYKDWTMGYKAVSVDKVDTAVKAAMCDGRGAAWTEDEQLAARSRIGVERRLHLLEEAANGKLYTEETDSDEAYRKDVPSGALTYASLTEIGGKTVVWNQLIKNYTGHKGEMNGVTVSSTDNYRHVTLTGTPTVKTFIGWTNLDYTLKGHKVYFSIGNVLNGSNYATIEGQGYINNTECNKIITLGETSKGFYPTYIYANDLTVEFTGETYFPIIVDLTAMFGSGNEPTDTSDPRISAIEAYAEAHPEYNAGELVSADIMSVVNRGRNLYQGITYNISYYDIGTTIPAGTQITFSCDIGAKKPTGSVYYYDTDKAYLDAFSVMKGNVNSRYSQTITTTQPLRFLYKTTADMVSNIQIVVGTLATYVPYRDPITYPIPSSVRTQYPLRSAGNVHDSYEFDGEKWWHVKRVGDTAVDLAYPVLDAEEHTDITSLMNLNSIIEVEGGGSLTFEQSNGELAVPSIINYLVKTTGA